MPKIITTNFGTIADALNKLIINEVKAALRLLPDQRIEAAYNESLCRIVVSPNDDYQPHDFSVQSAWLDEQARLHVSGRQSDEFADYNDYDEDADWLDITDFHYLIEQIKDELPDREYPHPLTSAGDKLALLEAIESSRQCY